MESNALIDIEFGEFRGKLKNLEFRQNSSFLVIPGCYLDRFRVIWNGSAPSVFSFSAILESVRFCEKILSNFDGHVNYVL